MSDDSPDQEQHPHGRIGRGLSTSVRGNSPAFGFSITITGAFGIMSSLAGTPDAGDVLFFGVAAAAAIGTLEGIVSRGFRGRAPSAPGEVELLATSLNAASVGAGIGTAIAVAEVLGGGVGWPVAGFATAGAYVLAEAVEVVVAELIQAARGDPRAGETRDED